MFAKCQMGVLFFLGFLKILGKNCELPKGLCCQVISIGANRRLDYLRSKYEKDKWSFLLTTFVKNKLAFVLTCDFWTCSTFLVGQSYYHTVMTTNQNDFFFLIKYMQLIQLHKNENVSYVFFLKQFIPMHTYCCFRSICFCFSHPPKTPPDCIVSSLEWIDKYLALERTTGGVCVALYANASNDDAPCRHTRARAHGETPLPRADEPFQHHARKTHPRRLEMLLIQTAKRPWRHCNGVA